MLSSEMMPYDFRNPPPGPPGPRPPGPRPPRPPADYGPGSNLPIYPTFSVQVINGVKYKAYYETDWNQVLTEDGVSLRKLLKSLPIYNKEAFYHYKGIIRNRPDMSAMDQLYSITNAMVGDLWLVQTNWVNRDRVVCEAYVFLGPSEGWVFSGTTDRSTSILKSLPKTLQLAPADLGEANQFLVVSEDGKHLTWGDPVKDHNEDPKAHADIRKLIEDIEITAAKIRIISDTIKAGNWTYNGSNGYFEYVYTHPKIPSNCYFEITPIIEQREVARAIAIAGMHPVYQICSADEYPSYAILKSLRVPTMNIDVSVKVFGGAEVVCDHCNCDNQ